MTEAMEPNITVLIVHGVGYKKMLIRYYDTTDYTLQQIVKSWEHCLSNDYFKRIQSRIAH